MLIVISSPQEGGQNNTPKKLKKKQGKERQGLRGPAVILSYRAILVAIVSQNSSVLVLMRGITQVLRARYVAKRAIAQMCLCETKCQGGYHKMECYPP